MVLTTTKEEANDFGVKAVGTEHLLLAMLSMNNTLSCRTLNKYGIYYDDFRKNVVEFYESELEGTDFYRNVLMKIDYTKWCCENNRKKVNSLLMIHLAL